MRDMLRMTGVLPPEPDKPNAVLEKVRERGWAPAVVDTSALEILHKIIVAFFAEGPAQASMKFSALNITILSGEATIRKDCYPSLLMQPLMASRVPWNSCKLATTLVLVLAASNEGTATFDAMKFMSQSLGGLPTLQTIQNTPSASLATAFAKAKKAALDGKVGKVTVLGVNLVDVEMIERGENCSRDMAYTSFAHSFVLGISRAGWRIYQSWGEHGYRLDEWLANGGAVIRDWEAAKLFLKSFIRLAVTTVCIRSSMKKDNIRHKLTTSIKGSWSTEINDAYEECFNVNILDVCGKSGPQNPIVPKYRPWVRIFEIEDVKPANIQKFTWE